MPISPTLQEQPRPAASDTPPNPTQPKPTDQNKTKTEYGQVLRMLGNGRCECYCFDGKNRLAHIRGKMRKKVWVGAVSPSVLEPGHGVDRSIRLRRLEGDVGVNLANKAGVINVPRLSPW